MQLHRLQGMFRINFRVIILVILFLFLLDQWILYAFEQKIKGDGVFRLQVEEKHVLESYLERIRNDAGKKVLFLGDSAMFGSATAADNETIPAYVAEIAAQKWPGEQVHFYNIAMRGLGSADAYHLLQLLQDSPHVADLIVYNVNIGWLTDEKLVNRQLILDLYPIDRVDWAGLKLEKPNKWDPERLLGEHVMKHWNLYRYRYMVSYWLFGKPIYHAIEDAADRLYETVDSGEDSLIYLPWYEKEWDDKLAGDWKIGRIYENNKQWQYFDRMLQLMSKTSRETMVYFTPRNGELLQKYDKVDHVAMKQSKEKITKTAMGYQIHVFDFEDLVESSQFSDTIHPLSEGNRTIAEAIVREMERLSIF